MPKPTLTPTGTGRSRRPLDPIDRVSEVLFGLIMVLSFTGSLSVAEAGREDIRAMLIGALGCNLAWGIIDAVLYLMSCMAERGGGMLTFNAIRKSQDAAEANRLLADALPPVVASVMQPSELDSLRLRLRELPDNPDHARLKREDWMGGIAVFLWVFSTTFPVTIPFIVMHEVGPALRVSNGIAVAMLVIAGVAFGRITGRNPWLTGVSMLVLGLALVAITIALGG